MTGTGARPNVDELIDGAVAALNRGDRATADALAGQVLAVDHANPDAEELLAAPADSGELRRLTMLFADLVDSTALSTRVDPEVYRTVVGGYRAEVIRLVEHYEGHLCSTKGDGLLAVFGHPRPHEDDARRAVQAGLEITRTVAALSARVRHRFGFDIAVRVGVHRGLVYLDITQDDVYGLGVNLAARVCSIADPGTVAVSAAIARVVGGTFELAERPAQQVKGVDEPVTSYRVVGERDATRSPRGPLVGRERELAVLRKAWARAAAGGLTTPGVVLSGEGGIGKSRLARAVADQAARDGAVVLELYGSPFHTDVGLRPVRRLLERRCGIGRDSDPAGTLARLTAELRCRGLDPDSLVPLLAPVLGIGPESGHQPVTANAGRLYDRIAAAVRDYLRACVGAGPGLLLAEDVHWYDEDTVEVLQNLLRERPERLLVVVTGRRVPELEGTVRLALPPLTADESDVLIRTLHPQMAADDREAVRRRCDGIPLYIEEVVTKVKELRADPRQPGEVPDTLYETLMARLGSDRAALPVVEAAALIGSLVDRRLLAEVVDLPPERLDPVLELLTRSGVLRPFGAGNWRFRHELLREVAAELSPPSQRRRLHSRIADALVHTAADGTPEWKLVALHCQAAERFADAAAAYQKAAGDARHRGALGEARTHLTRALENVQRMPAGPDRDRREVAVRLERGFLTYAAAGHASTDAAAEFERCLHLIRPEPSRELLATFSALWGYFATRGDLRRCERMIDALTDRLGSMPEWYLAANDVCRGALHLLRGDFRSARTTLEHATAALERSGAPDVDTAWFAPNEPLAGGLAFLGLARFVQGDLAAAEAAFTAVENRCERLAFPHGPFTLCYARGVETLTRIESGDLRRAAALAEEIAQRGRRHGFDEWVIIAECNRHSVAARTLLAAGERDPAVLQPHIDANAAIVSAWRAAAMMTFLSCYDSVLARLLLAAGRSEAARAHLDLALRTGAETGIRFYDAELLRVRAHTHPDPRQRHAGLCEAIELARAQGGATFEVHAAADDFELVGEPARPALTEALNRFPAAATWPALARARALLR